MAGDKLVIARHLEAYAADVEHDSVEVSFRILLAGILKIKYREA